MTGRTFRSSEVEPRRRGEELGRLHRDQVHACVDAYKRLLSDAAGADVDLHTLGLAAHHRIAEISPALAAEIEGIADGAGLPVAEVAAVNARTEILACVRRTGATVRGECSSVVQLRDASEPLAVQAWDWYESLAGSWFVWEIPHADGTITRTLTEYGIVGKIGVNDSGLGLLFNILHHRQDGDGDGIGAPVHVLARAVLDGCTDLHQALLLLAAAPVTASTSMTLVAARGRESAAVSVELGPPVSATPSRTRTGSWSTPTTS